MNAENLIAALGGRWHGSYGTASCPAHRDRNPSLSVSDGEDGIVLFHCHAGCSQAAVSEALRARGLFGNEVELGDCGTAQRTPKDRSGNDRRRTEFALKIWREAAPVQSDDMVTGYLRTRRIDLPIPPSIRISPAQKHSPSGQFLPCMVAAVQEADRRITAVHRTYLDPSGKGKAKVSTPKMAMGPFGRGAVRLGAAGEELGLAEGIETGLSAMQLFEVPVWCALGSRLDAVDVPDVVRHVIIFADNGDAGIEAAEKAADRHTSDGRYVTIRRPPEADSDFNDTLRGRSG